MSLCSKMSKRKAGELEDAPERSVKPWCDFKPLNDILGSHYPSSDVGVRLTQIPRMLSMLGFLAVLN